MVCLMLESEVLPFAASAMVEADGDEEGHLGEISGWVCNAGPNSSNIYVISSRCN
jgi:hypothetical protein